MKFFSGNSFANFIPGKILLLFLFVLRVVIFPNGASANKSEKPKFDTLDFAPGYPHYSVSQLDQLNSFPLPRYKTGTALQRNFSWFDFLYMGYDYSQCFQKDNKWIYPGWNQKVHALSAVDLNAEMAAHWNYYFNIATPTYNYPYYKNPNCVPGAQVKYANDHPEVKTCTYLFWVGVNPSTAGFDSKKAYIKDQANINPCGADTAFSNVAKDGMTERFYLKKLMSSLPARDPLKKIDFVNEDGEVFGGSWTPNAEGYRGSDFISCIQPDSGNARAFRARWQYHVFNAYKKQFIGNDSLPGLKNSAFSFYQVAGFLPNYYSEWSEMRYINSSFHNSYYSTPDFYPGQADHSIFPRYSFYHGLDCIEEGRKHEIACGDSYFSPFVAAGWFADSLNFRPAEWLAATKALAMMGAEFYYSSFFNTVNLTKQLPIDPRGYIYQVAMPAYAQAITSRYEKIFFNSKDFTYLKDDDRLVIYRKDNSNLRGPVYAIHASVFSPGNFIPAPELTTEEANIDGDRLKLNLRKQGSTYIYDKSDPSNIVFYQLDQWHEAHHPFYWSKDFDFEAELNDDQTYFHLKTERPAGADKNDYTHFTTFVCFDNAGATNNSLTYNFESRKDTSVYYVWVHARSSEKNVGKTSSLNLSLDNHSTFEMKGIAASKFQWYCLQMKGKPVELSVSPNVNHFIQVKAGDAFLELDRIILSETKTPSGIDLKE